MPIFQDTFTDTTSLQLQSHTPDVGTSWTRLWGSVAAVDLIINASNQLTPETDTDDGSIYTADATYPSANYKITFTRVAASSLSTRPTYFFLRLQDVDNLYALRLGGSGAGEAQLYRKNLGIFTAIGSAFAAPAAGSIVEFEIIGSTLKVRDDSTEIASETDITISAAGKAGIGAGGGAELVTTTDDSSVSNIIDSFQVDDLGAAAVGNVAYLGRIKKRYQHLLVR